jgi:hypothetical protein
MATNESRDPKQALYAVAGVADLAVSTIRHLPDEAQKLRDRFPQDAARAYGNLVERGESLLSSIRGSRSTQRASRATRVAVNSTKAAGTRARSGARSTRSAARGASTTVRRAASEDAKAAKSAAEKLGEDR